MKKLYCLLFGFAVLCSCGDDTGTTPSIEYNRTGPGVFVCNEGTFNNVSASLTFYDKAKAETDNDIFWNANALPLGDVCYSMSIIDGKGYVVVNNSGKVVVINTDTFKKTGEITGLNSPRYIAAAGNSKLYVTSLYSSQVAVVDRNTLQVTGHIDLGASGTTVNSSEHIVVIGQYAYVCSWSFNNKVFKIDTATDLVVGETEVALQPNTMAVDRNGMLWVLSDGSYEGSPAGQQHGALTCLDPGNLAVQKVITFPDINSSPKKLCIDGTGEYLYFLNGTWAAGGVSSSGVYRISVGDNAFPAQAYIPEDGKLFYGLGVDPTNSDIYVSDAVDYMQRGIVYRYSVDGRVLDEFRAGIIPGSFCFKD